MRWMTLAVAGLVAGTAGCGDSGGTVEPRTGTLQITTATTNPIAAEYNLVVDGASPRIVIANGSLSIPAMVEGTHLLQLAVPTGCTIDGDNPRSVNVIANATTTVSFAVTCTPAGTAGSTAPH